MDNWLCRQKIFLNLESKSDRVETVTNQNFCKNNKVTITVTKKVSSYKGTIVVVVVVVVVVFPSPRTS